MKKVLFFAVVAFAMMACCNKAAESSDQEGTCEKQECCKKDSGKCCKDTASAEAIGIESEGEALQN